MSNKYPQYFTAKGLERRKNRPTSKEIVPQPSETKSPAELRLDEIKNRLKQEMRDQAQPAKLRKPENFQKTESSKPELSLVTTPAQKIDRKRKMMKKMSEEKRSISPAAAKAIAEAIKGMLHS